jgi:Ca2+-binding EF-hand superfamily protein
LTILLSYKALNYCSYCKPCSLEEETNLIILRSKQDRESQKATPRVFDLFVEDPKGTVTFELLKKVAIEKGDNSTDEDLRRIIKNGASNGNDITYVEFHSIMIKDISLK